MKLRGTVPGAAQTKAGGGGGGRHTRGGDFSTTHTRGNILVLNDKNIHQQANKREWWANLWEYRPSRGASATPLSLPKLT